MMPRQQVLSLPARYLSCIAIEDTIMVQSLKLGNPVDGGQSTIPRVNRLPVIIAIGLILLFLAVVVFGLSWRGLSLGDTSRLSGPSSPPATNFGEQLKRGVTNGIIGEPERPAVVQASPQAVQEQHDEPPTTLDPSIEKHEPPARGAPISDTEWKARLKREQDEQYLREAQRQRMARLQARATAFDAPLKIDIPAAAVGAVAAPEATFSPPRGAGDLYAAALKAGLGGPSQDPNGQNAKEEFFNQDIRELGYLPNQVVPKISTFELKRGSVIPATLITGLNSDLPGRLVAQVSQDVYDSATGNQLLIPQGARLFGRYDSKVSFGQARALVAWTDLIFPDGSTLRMDGMAGTDGDGYGGFSDKVDRHLFRTFGSAALVAVIGAGIDMSIPESSTRAKQDTASDAARRNFAETFGRAAEQTISKNLNVQPTIQIRPGYRFNVLVDQDMVFPSGYRRGA
jgi:type IV secretion system protein TrbI